jgi:hypothetical protein
LMSSMFLWLLHVVLLELGYREQKAWQTACQ